MASPQLKEVGLVAGWLLVALVVSLCLCTAFSPGEAEGLSNGAENSTGLHLGRKRAFSHCGPGIP